MRTSSGITTGRGGRRALLAGLVAATAAATAAALLPPAWAAGETDTPPPAGPVRSAGVQWQPCPSEAHPDKQCARVKVPRVYGRPGAGSVRIAIARIPATGTPDQRIGSLFWDAGGPGGASTAMIDPIADRMSRRVRARFDFVAFDPRGIGSSTPALENCRGPWPVLPALNPTPSWRRAQRRSATDLAAANRACVRASKRWVNTMGTNTVVRDLDRLRRAVGDRKLTFWGTSYGTRIGYVFALRYPRRVRAMVLDGNIDPTGDYAGLPEIGGSAQDLALRFMKRRYRAGYRAIVRTLSGLTQEAVPLPDGTRFTRWDWLNLAGAFVAFQNTWPDLPQVAKVVRLARGTGPKSSEARRTLAVWRQLPNSNEGGGFSVVNCLD